MDKGRIEGNKVRNGHRECGSERAKMREIWIEILSEREKANGKMWSKLAKKKRKIPTKQCGEAKKPSTWLVLLHFEPKSKKYT